MNLLTNFLMISPEIQKKENSNVYCFEKTMFQLTSDKCCSHTSSKDVMVVSSPGEVGTDSNTLSRNRLLAEELGNEVMSTGNAGQRQMLF